MLVTVLLFCALASSSCVVSVSMLRCLRHVVRITTIQLVVIPQNMESLRYAELQQLAKQCGVKANMKAEKLKAALGRISLQMVQTRHCNLKLHRKLQTMSRSPKSRVSLQVGVRHDHRDRLQSQHHRCQCPRSRINLLIVIGCRAVHSLELKNSLCHLMMKSSYTTLDLENIVCWNWITLQSTLSQVIRHRQKLQESKSASIGPRYTRESLRRWTRSMST